MTGDGVAGKSSEGKWCQLLLPSVTHCRQITNDSDGKEGKCQSAGELTAQSGRWWRHLVAGGIAGVVSRTTTAPLDRLKVTLQVNATKEKMSQCFLNLIKEGGIVGLWRGNGINIIKIAPESAIKFAAYEQCKRFILGARLEDPNPNLKIQERFFSGAVAGGISQTLIYPLEVLKTRLALRKTGQYAGIIDAAKKIYAREGLRSFFRGYVPNMLGIVPYAGIDLAAYETLKHRFLKSHQNEDYPHLIVVLLCGSASCTLAQLFSYPLVLVRTRLQAQDSICAKDSAHTMMGVLRGILQKEGFLGLYRGITPNFIKVIPAVSISYVVYENASRELGVKMT